MNSPSFDTLSPLQRAALALQEMRSRIEALERSQMEPIAIIGLGCRFPGGADSPEAFWQLLQQGRDGVRQVPEGRWGELGGDGLGDLTYPRRGGFLETVDRFDAEFFGISPREAMSLDPQQRLLLEVSWETLEQAGLDPSRLMGSEAGVFIGISLSEYLQATLFGDPAAIDVYTATGNALSVAAGRLAYALGLQGPAIALDTACSSSLVAVHLACQSLRLGECRLALAGGVSLMLAPQTTLAMAKLKALSADGTCKTFDAAADGYGRGEGCGMVALKRLRDAQADQDRILAVIRGSAVNQDGRSSGLTVPNGKAQQAVIQAALHQAQVDPAQVTYVEAHGTGTPLGDPIEVRALAAVLGQGRLPDQPLYIGSVKTNLGHLEAAAGIASLIKTTLALYHQAIPPHLHLTEINPHIDLAAAPITLPTQLTAWPEPAGASRYAGVSSFGFSGTNAHLVLASAPEVADRSGGMLQQRDAHILCLSAKTETALWAQIQQWVAYLQSHPAEDWAAICGAANRGRSHFAHRWAVVAATGAELLQGLQAGAVGTASAPPWVYPSPAEPLSAPLQVAGYFPSEQTQAGYWGQGLYATAPVFHAAIQVWADGLTDAFAQGESGWPQPDRATFLAVWQGGAEQQAEWERRWQRLCTAAGQFALVHLWRSWGVEAGGYWGDGVGRLVAAWAGGTLDLVALVRACWDPETDRARVEATMAPYCEMQPEWQHWQGVLVMGALPPDRETVSSSPMPGSAPPTDPVWLPAWAADQGNWAVLGRSLSHLYVRGWAIDWQAVEPQPAAIPWGLPTYPFERQHYGIDLPLASPSRQHDALARSSHPLLGQRLSSPLTSIQFETTWTLDALPLVRDHVIQGQPIVNLVVYLELVQAGAISTRGRTVSRWQSLLVPHPLVMADGQSQTVQLILTPQGSDRVDFQVFSWQSAAGEVSWLPHLTGQAHLTPEALEPAESPPRPSLDLADLQHRSPERWDAATFYQQVLTHGAVLGSSCQVLETVWRQQGAALGRLQDGMGRNHPPYDLPLAAWDAGFQLLVACLPPTCADAYIILSLEQIEVFPEAAGATPTWGYAQIHTPVADWTDPTQTATLTATVMLLDGEGQCLVQAINLQLRRWQPAPTELKRVMGKTPFPSGLPSAVPPDPIPSLVDVITVALADQPAVIERYLIGTLAQLLRLPPSKLKGSQHLAELIDSLMAFELRQRIEADLQVRLSIEQFLGTATLTQLAIAIGEQRAIATLTTSIPGGTTDRESFIL